MKKLSSVLFVCLAIYSFEILAQTSSKNSEDKNGTENINNEMTDENSIENSQLVSLFDVNGNIDLIAVEVQWEKVRADSHLDKEFLGPVQFSDLPTLTEMRSLFDIPYSTLGAWGNSAAKEFYAQPGDAVNSDEAFLPILDVLNLEKIKKSFFLYRSGEGYFYTYLLVVDNQMRVFGFKIGYSE